MALRIIPVDVLTYLPLRIIPVDPCSSSINASSLSICQSHAPSSSIYQSTCPYASSSSILASAWSTHHPRPVTWKWRVRQIVRRVFLVLAGAPPQTLGTIISSVRFTFPGCCQVLTNGRRNSRLPFFNGYFFSFSCSFYLTTTTILLRYNKQEYALSHTLHAIVSMPCLSRMIYVTCMNWSSCYCGQMNSKTDIEKEKKRNYCSTFPFQERSEHRRSVGINTKGENCW